MYDDFFVRSIRVEDRKFLSFLFTAIFDSQSFAKFVKINFNVCVYDTQRTPRNGFFDLTTDIIWINFKLSYITFLSLFIIFWRCKQ